MMVNVSLYIVHDNARYLRNGPSSPRPQLPFLVRREACRMADGPRVFSRCLWNVKTFSADDRLPDKTRCQRRGAHGLVVEIGAL